MNGPFSLIPPPPATQCLASETFSLPPLDGSMKIPEIYDWHLQNSPNHPLFVYDDDEGAERVISWATAVRALHRAGRVIQSRVKRTDTRMPVVAILASCGTFFFRVSQLLYYSSREYSLYLDTITYFTVIAGIMRAGYSAFPISTRNSPAAVAHLLQKVNAAHVLVGTERALQTLISESLALIEGEAKPFVSVMLSYDNMYLEGDEDFVPLASVKYNMDDIAYIMHSSGSTAFPKPIYWTYYQNSQGSLIPCQSRNRFYLVSTLAEKYCINRLW